MTGRGQVIGKLIRDILRQDHSAVSSIFQNTRTFEAHLFQAASYRQVKTGRSHAACLLKRRKTGFILFLSFAEFRPRLSRSQGSPLLR